MTHVLSLSVIALVLGSSSVVADEAFEGKWVNVDDMTRGLTRLEISKKDKAWAIQAWGATMPVESDIGKVTLHVLGDSVGDKKMKYGFASWDKKFADTHLTLRLEQDELVVETFTVFKDESGRSNYRKVEKFKKK